MSIYKHKPTAKQKEKISITEFFFALLLVSYSLHPWYGAHVASACSDSEQGLGSQPESGLDHSG